MAMRSINRFGLALVALAFVCGLPALASAQGRSPQQLARLADSVGAVGGRVIILLKSSSGQPRLMAPGSNPLSDAEIGDVKNRLERAAPGLSVSATAPMVGALFGRVDVGRLASLNADPNVLMMEADRVVYLQANPADHLARVPRVPADATGSDRLRARAQDLPWGISQVTAPGAWAQGFRGAGVKVGILDTGGDATHPDLAYAGGYNAVTGGTNPSDWADNIPSCNGHGTHVAGTIAGRDNSVGVVGVAPDASIYALKVFEDLSGGCGAWVSTQITALNWATNNGIRVINASLGGSWSASYQIAVDQAAARGIFFVAAAGNDNGGPVTFPAAFPSSIAVASLSASSTRSSFSNVGPELAVSAPGENIESTLPGGIYGYKSGTSMATPHVTGIVALLVQQNPSITLAAVRAALQSGALDIDAAGFDFNTGWGLARALNSLQGGGAPPLTLSVSAVSRSASVTVGGSAPGDAAGVTLTGTNSASTTWTATKKKAWTSLTLAGGTGNGTVAWTRSAAGLSVGVYVDTITVTAPGAASGSPAQIYDTLRITAAVVPVTLAVSPGSRSVAVAVGGGAPGSSGTVTLSGTNAAATTWSATKKQSWTTLTTSSGTGSGTVAWTRSTATLPAGTYVDTITVSAPGAAGGSPAMIYDTILVSGGALPVALTVSPGSRNVQVQQFTNAPADNATVTLTGTNAASTAWTASKKKSWNTLTTASGTGSGTVAWARAAAGLAVGVYVDTITITAPGAASGSPSVIYDTMRITSASASITLAVSPSGRSVTVPQFASAPADNATVSLTGTNAASTAWTATKKKSWTTLTSASGTGSGTVAWNRAATGLAIGLYVDTITVTAPGAATGSPAVIYDTMRITSTATPIVLAASPSSRRVSVSQGTAAPGDNATISLTGTNASSVVWTASAKKSWTSLTTANGTGSATLAWNRSTTGLGVGVYVDTITVTAPGAATGSPATIIDTLQVTAVVSPLILAVSPSSRSVAITQGSNAPGDHADVALTGANSGSAVWSATRKKSWTSLTTPSGTSSGSVTWSRAASGLGVGIYVDTITVIAPGAVNSPSVIYDTIRVAAAPVPVTVAVSPSSRNISVTQGSSAPGASATVTLAGTNAAATGWNASNKKSWTVLTSANGSGSGTLAWTRSVGGLSVGTYVDTITIALAGSASLGTLYDTIRVTPLPSSVHGNGKKTRLLAAGQSSSIAPPTTDSALVELDTGAESQDLWSATTSSPRLQLVISQGVIGEHIVWQRLATTLPAGIYLDSMEVQLQRDANVRGYIVDTLEVVSVSWPEPTTAVEDLFYFNRLTSDQRVVLDGQGNANGKYDIGDFLAWLDKAHIRLSPAVASRLQQLMVKEPARPTPGAPADPRP